MNKIRYNSKYNIDKYNRQTKSSLYIPKDWDIAFETPLMIKIPIFDDDFYIINITNPGPLSKYKTYIYDASIEHFKKDIIEFSTKKNIKLSGGVRIQYPTMWSFRLSEPEIIRDIKNIKSISHKTLKKYINNVIDDVEYTKILLTMDKIDD